MTSQCCPQPPQCAPLVDGVYDNARIVVENGCIKIIESGKPFVYQPEPCCGGGGGGGGTTINVTNTESVRLSGDGGVNTPVKADVRISPDSGNVIQQKANGVYVSTSVPPVSTVAVTGTQSAEMTGDGTAVNPIATTVRLSADPDSIIKEAADGLFVPKPSADRSTDAGNLLIEGTDGKSGVWLNHHVAPRCVETTGMGSISDPVIAVLHTDSDVRNTAVVTEDRGLMVLQRPGPANTIFREESNGGLSVRISTLPGNTLVNKNATGLWCNAGLPIGTIAWRAVESLAGAPDWLVCDGQWVQIADYYDLYQIIGTTWGGGDTRFSIPDARARTLISITRGKGSGYQYPIGYHDAQYYEQSVGGSINSFWVGRPWQEPQSINLLAMIKAF